MQLQERIAGFEALGKYLDTYSLEEKMEIAEKAKYYNPWFTVDNILFAFEGIRKFLSKESLEKLTERYSFKNSGKIIGLVMAGNIPLVGFHDLLCILLSGHKAMVKLSSKDEVLPRFILDKLNEVAPAIALNVDIVDKLKGFDGVIATGSDNTSRYFEYYFGKYPGVIRKNRTSVAILGGSETSEELEKLTDDILLYFGLGCRNVSKILVPEGYNFEPLFKILDKYEEVANHNKYRNNYDYYKSIYLVNREHFYDTGFIMFKKDEQLVSPVSTVYYEEYSSIEEAKKYVEENKEKIQVVVASEHLQIKNSVVPGKAQLPEIDDFADRVDTMKFLSEL